MIREPSHAERPSFTKHRPLHVTLEMAEDVPNLRAVNLVAVVIDAIGRANVREDFRVVHLCIVGTHVHLICEAEGAEELACGMKSLNGTIARALNERLRRKGKVFVHRFHLHVLRTKAEVRNAVRYVLRNAEHHGLHESWPGGAWPGRGGADSHGMPRPDPLSTAAWFPYWAERELIVAPTQIPASVVRPAQCFLMKLAFEYAPLSFAEPMGNASWWGKAPSGRAKRTSQHGSRARTRPKEVARVQEVGTAPNQVPPRRQVLL
jgi:REP element-mobilizing transposase RayT